jgi:hypothetical protein
MFRLLYGAHRTLASFKHLAGLSPPPTPYRMKLQSWSARSLYRASPLETIAREATLVNKRLLGISVFAKVEDVLGDTA